MSKRTNRSKPSTMTLPAGYLDGARKELERAALAFAGFTGQGGVFDEAERARLETELRAAAFRFGTGMAHERTGSLHLGVRRLRGEAAIAHAEATGRPLNCWGTCWGEAFRDDMTPSEARTHEERRRQEREKYGDIAKGWTWEQIFVDVGID